MKIKQLPEDFQVEEVADRQLLPAGQAGEYRIFLLEKRGLDTFGAKRIIGSTFKIASQDIGVAGLKDKHAVTRQFISVPAAAKIPQEWSDRSIKLRFVGFTDKPILLGELVGNLFTVTVRDIKKEQVERLATDARRVLDVGVPNYFDSQRFGSLRGAENFIAKHLIRGNFEQAVKVILTSSSRHDPAQVRHCREAIKSAWGLWDRCLIACEKAPRARREKRMLSYLHKNPSDFPGAFELVERELQKMYVAAYQSYLWNECAKVILRRALQGVKIKTVEYEAGTFEFPLVSSTEQVDALRAHKIPLIHPTAEFADDETRFACLKVLKEEGISLSDLAIPGRKDLAFKEGVRDLWVWPGCSSEPQRSKDELNSTSPSPKSKMVVSFDLPPGSYATVVLKAMGVVKKARR